MSAFKEIKANEINSNVFELIGTDWMLVTAGNSDKANTMTASWGGMGIMWHKNVAFLVIRPQRYTKEFIDSTDNLSISFFDASYKETLTYLGTVSGRDEDKIANSNLTLTYIDQTPCFEQAKMTLICKKMYKQVMSPDSIFDDEVIETWYPQKDFHTMYIVEIAKVLVNK